MIQTKLFKVNCWNSAKYYFTGDSEELEASRLDDYAPLYNWNSNNDLVVVMGDWTCTHCSLNWQFAKVTVGISYSEIGCMVGNIKSIETFTPKQVEDFTEVHRIDEDFVLHGGFQTRQDWLNTCVKARCIRMLEGFHNWGYEFAGVTFTG